MVKQKTLSCLVVFAVFGGIGLAPTTAIADFIFKGTASASQADPNIQSGQADFSLSGTTLTITLKNLESNSSSNLVGQGMALSGITFRINGGTLGSASLASAAGSVVNVANNTGAFGAPTAISTNNVLADTHWGLDNNGNNTLDLHSPGSQAQGNPTHMILGTPAHLNQDGSGNYDVISGNVFHFDPYFYESATFTLTVNGINANNFSIDQVVFSFGTSNNEHTANGVLVTAAPEPSSLVLAGAAGLTMLAVAGWRRRSWLSSRR